MKNLTLLSVVLSCLLATNVLWAVKVDEDNQYVIIKTDNYELHWKKQAQMGYMEVFIGGAKNSIITPGGRAFYHSSDYAGGWKDWSALIKWKELEEEKGKAVIQYESKDAGTKEYTCVATYWDSVSYIRHEVTVKNTGDAVVKSFEDVHDPMFETNAQIKGMKKFDAPFPHAAYWVDNSFAAIYGPEAQSADLTVWGGRNPGRMYLNHDNKGKDIKKGESGTITYYVAFSKGEEKEATALADKVTKEPPSSTAINPGGKISTTWGDVKRTY